MKSFIAIEWAPEISGIDTRVIIDFIDKITDALLQKEYGNSISKVRIILICRTRTLKQRKRHNKITGIFDYDIILNIEQIKEAAYGEKKDIIRKQIIKVTEETFAPYKFADFRKEEFLSDFKQIVNTLEW